jgi:AraC family transcriptional regulator, arabinose operon regulatory protein
MIEWYNKVDTIRSEDFLPRLLLAACEWVDSAEYYFDNSMRQDEPHIALQYTLSGCGIFEVGGKQINVGEDELFIAQIPADNTKYYYPGGEEQPWRFVFCCFAGEAAFDLYGKITAKYGHIFRLCRQSPVISQLLEFEKTLEKPITAAEGAAFVFALITSLVESCNKNEQYSYNNLLVDKAINFIRNNLGKQLNVSETADALSVSREHLTRVFGQHLGISPRRYIENERLHTALGLLRNSDLSSKSIAYQCGFGSPGQFGRVFMRKMNDTPEKYRRRKNAAMLPLP